jgi:hypothetical protein
MEMIKSLFAPKKVKMSDVASPRPSKAAVKALDSAIKRAHKDQDTIRHKATAIRAN